MAMGDGSSSRVTKRFMCINRRAPYGTIYALEGLEVVLMGAAFEQDLSVVYLDDGVYQLKKGQDTADSSIKNFSPTYRALASYGVEKLYVETESMEERGLSEHDLIVPVKMINGAELTELMEQQDVILNY